MTDERQGAGQVFRVFLMLGLTSFGGPVAHLGYFRTAFVERLRWLDDRAYADLVALCQFLPGPASSQVGIGIGLARAGLPGAVAAWAGFTLPSAALMIALGLGVAGLGEAVPPGLLTGLKVAAVAVVAQALWGMARSLTPDAPRVTLAVLAAAAVLTAPGPLAQIGAILAGGAAGLWLIRPEPPGPGGGLDIALPRWAPPSALGLFALLLAGLPLLAGLWPAGWLDVVDGFYRAGALVFGGGHVVLPLLEAEVVPGRVAEDAFLAGYGAAQAVPGPLFTFAAYLGAVGGPAPNGLGGGLIALAAVFLPSFLLVIGVLPFWERLRRAPLARRALGGVNAAVVGLLLAALYDPVWTRGVTGPDTFILAALAFTALCFWKASPWAVVAASAAAGWGLASL